MKKIELLIGVLFGIGVIIMFSMMIFNHFKAVEKFCEYSFCGKIEEIKLGQKDSYIIKISNDSIYNFGGFISDYNIKLEVGDSLIKRKDCYKVILRKKGIDYDIGIPMRGCSCGKK